MRRYIAAVLAGALLFALGMAFRYALERPYPIDTYREGDDGILPPDPLLPPGYGRVPRPYVPPSTGTRSKEIDR